MKDDRGILGSSNCDLRIGLNERLRHNLINMNRIFEPYPLSKFKKLDIIKALLSKTDDQDQETAPSDFQDEDGDGVTVAKKARIETEDCLQQLFSDLELEPSDKAVLAEQLNSGCLILEDCLTFIRSLNNVSLSLEEIQVSRLAPIISKTIIQYKSEQNHFMEDLSQLSRKYPKLTVSVLTDLVPVTELSPVVLSLLDDGDLEEEKVVELFRLYLQSVPVTSNTVPSLEGFLSRRPELGRNSSVVTLLAENCLKNSTSELNNCLRFAKFYRKILTNFSGTREQALELLKPIIENNKTFLKNRMERDLREKFPDLTEMDTKTTTREEQD